MPSETPTDDDLLGRIRAGDDAAMRALLERYMPAVYRFGAKMCRNPDDAKDVVQETLLAAARGVRDFRGGASLSTWLFTIARSHCIKKHRRRVGEPEQVVSLDAHEAHRMPTPIARPDEAASDRELGSALDAAIASLDPAYREVLVLRDVEGLTAPEVASVLGLGVDAVKSRLHRARMAVRDQLAPLLAPSEGPALPGCPDLAPVLSQYLEGDIGAAQCAEMERHVAQCPRCTTRCDSLRRTLALCKSSASSGPVPDEVQDAVRTALRSRIPGP
jgi:RNA polymerase sigma-70 factor (ECF subfamily)